MVNFSVSQAIVFILWIISVNSKHNRKQNTAECGHPIGSYSAGKIVGGYDIGYYKYPWYVALKRNGEVFCGGTLIGSKYIVTAAHCFQPFFKAVAKGSTTFEQIFKPTFGVYNVCRHESTQKEFKIAKVHVHEEYKKQDPYYDIAMLTLKEEAKGFEHCCLPDKALDSRSRPKEGYVSGLGDEKFQAATSPCTIHEARILIYDDDVCRKMLDSQGESGNKLKHAFCAGYLAGGIDACQGDSGGPLIIADPGGRFSLLGITSFGFDCAKADTLGLYTDVSHYLDWLRDKMRDADAQTITRPPLIPVQSTTVDWSQYPVSPWTEDPTFEDPPFGDPYPFSPDKKPLTIEIIINFFKKRQQEKNMTQSFRNRKGRNE